MKDLRERQFVSKLDRYQLEDKYLRLLEEMQSLKKTSNGQEDKIKRLATKLMRVAANPSACINLHDICNDKEKISVLECENNKLKNKVNVLRNQLLSHVNQKRSPKRQHKVAGGTPSNTTICRTENLRLKTLSCQYLMQNDQEDGEVQKHLLKIQELETQNKEMTARISELENELENRDTENRREKIAENIEHIRTLRYIKECTGKLVVFENENKSLKAEIAHLKKLLTETRRINKEITSSLIIERKRITEMDMKILKSKDSDLSLREKNEQILDLMNEIKILQQHNSELIALSTKYSKIEMENSQLTKKVSEQISDHQILKNALNNEQANTSALQSANSQLLVKLNELQRNIDTLTIQLTAFQKAPERQERSLKNSLKEQKEKYLERKTSSSSSSSISENSSPELITRQKKIPAKESPDNSVKIEKESQTETSFLRECTKSPKNVKIERPQMDSGKRKISERRESQEMNGHAKTIQNGSTLSPEKMMHLLEQTQMKTSFVDSVSESLQKQRLKGKRIKFSQDLKAPENINEKIVNSCNFVPFKDPNQILSLFFKILRKYNSQKIEDENGSFISNVHQSIDTNNNETEILEENCPCLAEKDDDNNNINKNSNEIFNVKLKDSVPVKSKEKSEESECFCTCDGRCPNYFYRQINGKYVCCCLERYKINSNFEACSNSARPVENVDINASIRKKFGDTYWSRQRIVEDSFKMKKGVPDEEKEEKKILGNTLNEKSSNENFDKRKCGKFEEKLENESTTEEEDENDTNNTSELLDNSFLITKDQGLMEVHIVNLQLSKAAIKLLFQDKIFWNACFFVSWDIQGQKTSFTPALKYPKLNFDSSSIFVVSELFKFLDYIFEEYITFQVHAFYPNEATHTVAQTKLCIKEILDYPHNKMQYISSITSIIPCSYGINFGRLSLWVRLSCNSDKIKTFKTQRGIVTDDIRVLSSVSKIKKQNYFTENGVLGPIGKEEKKLSPVQEEDKSEINKDEKANRRNLNIAASRKENIERRNSKKISENKWKINRNSSLKMLSRNSVSSLSSSDFTEESSDENTHLKILEEVKAKIAMNSFNKVKTNDVEEFNKMISNNPETQADSENSFCDINEVLTDDNWDKFKTKRTHSLVYQNTKEKSKNKLNDNKYYLDYKSKKLNSIIIELRSMRLFEGCYIFLDPNIIQLYIEYSFLGYFGKDMETNSVPVPESPTMEMKYNFKKEFQIDEKSHLKQRHILRKMLKGDLDPHIKFIVVSEPLPEEQNKDCKEVGFAQLNLKDYVLGNYTHNMSLLIKNISQTKSLGHLRITVNGIEAMKNCL